MKKTLTSGILLVMLLAGSGCTNSQTGRLVEQQNAEVLALQSTKRQILLEDANTPEALLRKKAKLKIVNDEIRAAQNAQMNAQTIQNQKTDNTVKGVLTGVGALVGTAAVIHNITK